jgi:hypothetical protein
MAVATNYEISNKIIYDWKSNLNAAHAKESDRDFKDLRKWLVD